MAGTASRKFISAALSVVEPDCLSVTGVLPLPVRLPPAPASPRPSSSRVFRFSRSSWNIDT